MLSEQESVTFYTYSRRGIADPNRWANTGIPDSFFEDVEAARQAVRAIRKEVATDPVDQWSPVNIEKVETHPVTRNALLALLNEGVGAIIKSREIVETVE